MAQKSTNENMTTAFISPIKKSDIEIGKFFKTTRSQINPQINYLPSTISKSVNQSTRDRENVCENQDEKNQNINEDFSGNRSPRSIGTNTARADLCAVRGLKNKVLFFQQDVQPVTHFVAEREKGPEVEGWSRQLRSSSEQPILLNKKKRTRVLQSAFIPPAIDLPTIKSFNQPSSIIKQEAQPGIIHHATSRDVINSDSKNKSTGMNSNTKISTDQKIGVNNLVSQESRDNQLINLRSLLDVNKNNISVGCSFQSRRKSFMKNIGEIVNKTKKPDVEEQEKLEARKNFRISQNSFNVSKIKLPTFREESKEEFENDFEKSSQVNNSESQILDMNKLKSNIKKLSVQKNQSPTLPYAFPQSESEPLTPGTASTQNFLNSVPHKNYPSGCQYRLSISLRTSIQKLKQSLIQSVSHLWVSFMLPPALFKPPTQYSNSQELHNMMLSIFGEVGLTPQIVSIRKYINCVLMKDRKSAILWNFNGKFYFGGWAKHEKLIEEGYSQSEGVKEGVGIEWVPSSYLYYGQFKNNQKNGYGLLKQYNQEVYIGSWKNNMKSGWGKVFDASGELLQNGQFIEGRFICCAKKMDKIQNH